MTTTMAVEEIKETLTDLIDRLTPGDEIILTRNRQPVAKLVSAPAQPRRRRRPGLCKGMITLQVEDDEHLEGFAEYLA